LSKGKTFLKKTFRKPGGVTSTLKDYIKDGYLEAKYEEMRGGFSLRCLIAQ